MDDKLLQLIVYIIAALVWLLPRILRAVFKKKSAPQSEEPEAAPLETAPAEAPWDDYDVGQPLDAEPVVPMADYLQLEETCAALERQVADAIVENQARGEAVSVVAETLQTGVRPRLAELSSELRARRSADEPLYFDEALAYRNELSGLESTLLLLKQVSLERRRVGRADRYRILDRVAASMMLPYMEFAQMYGVELSTRRVLAVVGDLPGDAARILERQQIAVAPLAEAHLERAHLWPLMSKELALDFIGGVPGMLEEARAALGMPRVLPENVVFAGPRAAVAALYQLWLPQLIADTAATCQMGRSYLLALKMAFGDDYRADQTNRSHAVMLFSALSGGVAEAPLAVRVALVRGVLRRLQMPMGDEALTQETDQIVAHQQLVTVIDAHGQRVGVDGQTVAVAAERVAERLVLHQFQSLNNAALWQIPGLVPAADDAEQVAKIAEAFAAGDVATGAILTMLRAAATAVFEKPPLERKINKSLLLSLSEGRNRRRSEEKRLVAQVRPSIRDAWRSPDAWKSAVIAGALLAPRPHLGMSQRYRGHARREGS